MHTASISVVLAAAGLSLGVPACGERNGHDSNHDTTAAGMRTLDSHAHDAHPSASGGGSESSTATTTRLELTTAPAAVPAGQRATWTLRIVDATTGAPIDSFVEVHEKLMHLIVVAGDQEWFNHIHPIYKGNGEFVVETTLPKAGSYVLFADYAPAGREPEVYRHELATAGETLNIPTNSPRPDLPGEGGWIVKEAMARPEGEPDAPGGAMYQIALMPMPTKLVAGKDAMLHFQVRDADGREVTDLEPYLGALGHAVLLSTDSRTYLHTHPTDGAAEGHDHDGSGAAHDHATPAGTGGPDVVFHTSFPAAGRYKAWGQFMHRGRIITASFVLDVGLDSRTTAR